MGEGKVIHATPVKPISKADKKAPGIKSSPIPKLFEGEKAFVLATGPSLTQEVIDLIYKESGWRYIGISDCYRICPFLDFHYACDNKWWEIHYDKVLEWDGCKNGYWCTEQHTKRKFGKLQWVVGTGGKGWSDDPAKIHYGSNSGFQITNIAYLLGIKYMVLLGYNMMVTGNNKSPQRHFFGDHPQGLSRNSSYQSFAAQFEFIKTNGVKDINATEPSKLGAFPKMSLEDAIAAAPK